MYPSYLLCQYEDDKRKNDTMFLRNMKPTINGRYNYCTTPPCMCSEDLINSPIKYSSIILPPRPQHKICKIKGNKSIKLGNKTGGFNSIEGKFDVPEISEAIQIDNYTELSDPIIIQPDNRLIEKSRQLTEKNMSLNTQYSDNISKRLLTENNKYVPKNGDITTVWKEHIKQTGQNSYDLPYTVLNKSDKLSATNGIDYWNYSTPNQPFNQIVGINPTYTTNTNNLNKFKKEIMSCQNFINMDQCNLNTKCEYYCTKPFNNTRLKTNQFFSR